MFFRNTRAETSMDIGLGGTLNAILVNSSVQIYDLALKKVLNFVRGRILETKVSGKIAANICTSLCKLRPVKGLKAFLPMTMDLVEQLLEETDVTKEESLDQELKFNLLILSEASVKAICKIGLSVETLTFSVAGCPCSRDIPFSVSAAAGANFAQDSPHGRQGRVQLQLRSPQAYPTRFDLDV